MQASMSRRRTWLGFLSHMMMYYLVAIAFLSKFLLLSQREHADIDRHLERRLLPICVGVSFIFA
jgi:hypothetical protein